ncbi:MAG TPA: M1 family aminopeptidase [Steroidobacteraceae bacterium]|nr:M1 family aminopeptidase [Steroidobacteraceae bacterium]
MAASSIFLVPALAVALPVAAAQPFSFDAAPGRLPKDVVPLAYEVAIVPDVPGLTIAGSESVTLDFRSSAARIVFNSLNEVLHDVRLDGQAVRAVDSDDTAQLTSITLAAPAARGRHTLTFSYSGRIEVQPRGLFRQPYRTLSGEQRLVLSTKMESTDARRMFPCWDEPAFRATFALSVTVPRAWATIGNMPIARRSERGELATITFGTTPAMPSYLIEFTGGDLAVLAGQVQGTQLGIWADRGREQDGVTALANAQQILGDFDDYFGFAYPLPKLDSIAIPGGFGGAMENWGAITYNDQLLLVTPRSTDEDRQTVYAVQAHEMAHQWNGDLVTMGWWDDLWLNESFASWRGTKETDSRHPDWKWWEGQDRPKERAMYADSFLASHAIQQHVSDELQAASAFDPEITYDKGQAVLRMLEAYLGEQTFRDGVRRYVKAHAYSNATSADLWNALGAASHTDVALVAAGWIEQPGFPLVTVASRCAAGATRTLTLTQERFLLSAQGPTGTRWRVPLRVRSGTNGTPESVLLSKHGQTVQAGRCGEPLVLNAAAIGYYRVRYDAPSFAANRAAFGRLAGGDQIALLDDEWALVAARKEALADYLSLAASVGEGLDRRVWEQIAAALGTIEYDERGLPGHDAFASYARSVLAPPAAHLGWDARPQDTPDLRALRRTLLHSLGVLGDPDVISEARRRFAAFRRDRGAIAPDDQALVLSIVAQYADRPTFDELHAIARAARDETEQQRYFLALMDVGDPQLAREAAAIALSDEIPPQGARWRLQLVFRLANWHHALAWTTFRDNATVLLAPNPKYAPLITAQTVPLRFWDAVPLEELEAWVRAHVPSEMAPNVARGMESARFNAADKASLVPAADAYVAALKTPG